MGIIRKCQSDEDWDMFQAISPQGSIYMCSIFLNALEMEMEKLFFEVENKIVASTVIINSNGLPCFSMYQGITLAPISGRPHTIFNQQLKIISSFLEQLTSNYTVLNFSLSHTITDLRAFQWINYHSPEKGTFNLSLNYTGIINLKDYTNFESYLESIRSVRRQEWKKAIKNEFNVVESADVDEFIRLYKLTFDRQSINLDNHTIQIVRRITTFLIKGKDANLSFCYDSNGILHSAMLTLLHNKTRYYQFGATDPQFRSSSASVFLMLNNIMKAYEEGIEFFDMVGINSPNRGDFKLSFNAIPVPYFNVHGTFLNS